MPSPAIPGMFFAFAAAVLLLFASVSPPAWYRVPFLTAYGNGAETTVFGVFGECIKQGACTKANVGYDLQLFGADAPINPTGLHNLTYILIIHPIAGFVALLAFLMGLIGVMAASRFSTIMMSALSLFAALLTLVVFVIDMVLWNLLRKRIRNAGYDAELGIANWFTIAAFGSLVLAFCTSLCGACGRFASGRSAGEKY